MTILELQNQIQRKAQELPPDLLKEVFDYMEFVLKKRKKLTSAQHQTLEEWWDNLTQFSDDYMTERIQPPLDKTENLFE
ncbi:hypothetical protein DYBT9275_03996 [Dyadobacter sp. CECT 9275]|uniref:DUF2281 domain-containing protein n=1 Tax=Dyadobacter helix TaxID=2822344 RepID=A0A916JF10_9BACT|nr:DUF2281 domain-containing protein [Dyadobacter sp. CECT 9275]CAG5007225.1 hypothetical protein DYBT9275_03996 [Dyadobacter sp. CECT 9275]